MSNAGLTDEVIIDQIHATHSKFLLSNQEIMDLKNQGVLYAEIHERFAAETRQLLKEIGFDSIEIKKDLQGKDRMIKALK
jgi:methylase of polypeptide subunit release factors